MPEFNLVTVITSSAQTVAAIVMAVLLLGFQRQYRKTYVRHWTLSWAALAAYYVCSSIGMGLGLGFNMPSAHPVRLLTATLAGIFGYTTIVWLLFGIYELLRRRPVRIRFYWRTLAAVAAFGVITALLFVGPDAVSSTRYFVRIGIRSLIASLAYLGSSIAFWQVRKRRRGWASPCFPSLCCSTDCSRRICSERASAGVSSPSPPAPSTSATSDFCCRPSPECR